MFYCILTQHNKHKVDKIKAKLEVSSIIKTVQHMTLIVKTGSYRPDMGLRMDLHLINCHSYNRNKSDYSKALEESRQHRDYFNDIATAGTPSPSIKPSSSSSIAKQPKAKVKPVMQRQHVLTERKKMEFKIPKDDPFKYYYVSSNEYFLDFHNWLIKISGKSIKSAKQNCQSAKEI